MKDEEVEKKNKVQQEEEDLEKDRDAEELANLKFEMK